MQGSCADRTEPDRKLANRCAHPRWAPAQAGPRWEPATGEQLQSALVSRRQSPSHWLVARSANADLLLDRWPGADPVPAPIAARAGFEDRAVSAVQDEAGAAAGLDAAPAAGGSPASDLGTARDALSGAGHRLPMPSR